MSANRIHTSSQGESIKTSAGSHWSSTHTSLLIRPGNHRLTDRVVMLSHFLHIIYVFAFITTNMNKVLHFKERTLAQYMNIW